MIRRSRARTAVALVVSAVVLLNVALLGLGRLTRGPEGPPSSSYATTEEGVAAYADLLGRNGHPVRRLRDTVGEARLDPRATLVLLDPGRPDPADERALARFVEDGGALVAGGAQAAAWVAELLSEPPEWSPEGLDVARALVPVEPALGVEEVETAGLGVWEDAGEALPVLGDAGGAVVVVATRGRGRMTLLADTSILQNGLLGRRDNAVFALEAVGGRGRPVVFVESVHGYGRARGIAAIPDGWAWALGGLGLAALLFMWARGRRLGPAEDEERDLPPPRLEYVESLAAVLARTKRPGEAAAPLQDAVRRALVRRAALPAEASEDELRGAAARLGLTDDEQAAAFGAVGDAGGLAAAGRALARVLGGGRG